MSSPSNHQAEHEPQTGAIEAQDQRLPRPTTRHERRTLEVLEDTHGDAFRAYLTNVWDGARIEHIENEFTNLYWGSYPDRKTFIDSVIEGLGWKDGYDDLVERSGIPPGCLYWNYPLLLVRVQEDYELLDEGGSVHVFLK